MQILKIITLIILCVTIISCNPLFKLYFDENLKKESLSFELIEKVEVTSEATYFFVSNFVIISFRLDIRNESNNQIELRLNDINLKSKNYEFRRHPDMKDKIITIEKERTVNLDIAFGADIDISEWRNNVSHLEIEIYKFSSGEVIIDNFRPIKIYVKEYKGDRKMTKS